MLIKNRCILFFIVISMCSIITGQVSTDTVKITMKDADSIFLTQNQVLLSEKYNIDAAKALIIQNRLWDNPTFSVNQSALNPESATNGYRKWFDLSNTGETNAQVQQLILLAGKRNKRVKLAQLSAQHEEDNYFDLMRTLKFSLRTDFYTIYYLRQIVNVYNKETSSLTMLIKVFENQLDKGYTSKKEVLRLKSSLFSLENEKLGYSTQLLSNEADFNVLMHSTSITYVPEVADAQSSYIAPDSLNFQALMDTAFKYRYDMKMAQTDLDYNTLNLAYQKALSIPDITVSAGWDKNGSYVHNYNFVGLQFDIPLFNRNQGNIKSAGFALESSKYKLQNAEDQVKADITKSYGTLIETDRLYKQFDNQFLDDLDVLMREMARNYEKRNISLIEFLDYYDAYKNNTIQLNNLKLSRIEAFENLNYCVGKDITER